MVLLPWNLPPPAPQSSSQLCLCKVLVGSITSCRGRAHKRTCGKMRRHCAKLSSGFTLGFGGCSPGALRAISALNSPEKKSRAAAATPPSVTCIGDRSVSSCCFRGCGGCGCSCWLWRRLYCSCCWLMLGGCCPPGEEELVEQLDIRRCSFASRGESPFSPCPCCCCCGCCWACSFPSFSRGGVWTSMLHVPRRTHKEGTTTAAAATAPSVASG